MRVIICEDDKSLLQLIELIVSDLNVDIIKCTGEECLLEEVTTNQIDLVIVDYWLRKVKADNVIKTIKAYRPELPIILVSAVSNLSQLKDELKVNDYVKKPFDVDEFKLKVTNYLK